MLMGSNRCAIQPRCAAWSAVEHAIASAHGTRNA